MDFGGLLLEKLERTILHPETIITDPISDISHQFIQDSNDISKGISQNLQNITGSEDKKGLNALSDSFGNLMDNSINNINPVVMVGGIMGISAVLILLMKI